MLETPPAANGLLRCAFVRSGNLYTHYIDAVINGKGERLLSSVDRAGDDNCPPSPPWQQLHAHEQPDGTRALMLIGRAGKSHWSMSIVVNPQRRGFTFDVACRYREPPAFLGCTYRQTRANGRGFDLPSVRVSTAATDNAETGAIVEAAGDEIVVRVPATAPPPSTARWIYHIALDDR